MAEINHRYNEVKSPDKKAIFVEKAKEKFRASFMITPPQRDFNSPSVKLTNEIPQSTDNILSQIQTAMQGLSKDEASDSDSHSEGSETSEESEDIDDLVDIVNLQK